MERSLTRRRHRFEDKSLEVLMCALLVISDAAGGRIPWCSAEANDSSSPPAAVMSESPSAAAAEDNFDDFDLPDPHAYYFRTDWFTPNIKHWNWTLDHLRGRPNVLGLEIGSYEGRSAIWTLTNILTHPSSRLICCDYCDQSYFPLFLNNTRAFRRQRRLFVVKGSTLDALTNPLVLSGRFDMIVVDAGHSSMWVMLDALRTWPLLKRGGIMIFDDYLLAGESDEAPKPAIDKFLEWFEGELEVLHKDYQVVVKKVGGLIKEAVTSFRE